MVVVVTHPGNSALQYELKDEEYDLIYGKTSVMVMWKEKAEDGTIQEQRRLARDAITITNKGHGMMKVESFDRSYKNSFPRESLIEDAVALAFNDTHRLFPVALGADSITIGKQAYAFPKGSKITLEMDGCITVNGVEAVAPVIGKGIRVNRTPGQISHQAFQKKLGRVALLGEPEMEAVAGFDALIKELGVKPGVTSVAQKAKSAWDEMMA